MNSGLTRFRSAPSSYFASFLDAAAETLDTTTTTDDGGGRKEREDFSNARPLSPETENIFANFMSSMGGESNSSSNQKLSTAPTSMGMHTLPQINSNNNSNNNNNSGLTRHSSSPAGFFNSILLDIDNGYGAMKEMGNYGANEGQTNFSQGQPSSTSGLMTQNSDIAGKRIAESTNNNSSNNDRNYISGYPMSSWEDSVLSAGFASLDRGGGDDGTLAFSELNASENQSEEGRNRPQLLAHHLSLPSSSAMEKMLQFQDSVPCRIRAKRGCATHPRSIAERVRRTRISERMRKLQDLVPNMDKVAVICLFRIVELASLRVNYIRLNNWLNRLPTRVSLQQTNTSDMLDLAVEYIKDLQNQVKNLNDKRAKCTCPR
ncbi:hypothetical protein Cgig2_002308 [Carnegiea gigantea]|uniref:BHLH domain-containing protein n=1 Tax=Carnegiea gigantea TaxID=171969 RepID=A0A9Q1KVF0_9CARY|nr:hypothetical protein Cgig2_002308 [Carnegiea gigantea]